MSALDTPPLPDCGRPLWTALYSEVSVFFQHSRLKDRSYAAVINLVQHLRVDDLMRKLSLSEQLPTSVSTYLIKQKLVNDPEGDISTTSLKVSLLCPVSLII